MSEQKEQSEAPEVNVEGKEEEMAEAQTEIAGELQEEAAQSEETAEETVSEENAEVSEETKESEENEGEIDEHLGDLNKNDAAVLLIKKAKHIVQDAEAQMEACKLLLSDDLKEFEDAKTSLKNGGMEESEELLDTLGFDKDEDEEPEEVVAFEAKEEVSPVYIRDISSGKFTGFLLALIFGVATLLGLVYVATQKLGIPLDLNKIPTAETRNSVLSWFGSLVGMNDPMVGGAMLAVVVLLVMWIVYAIRVSVRASSNLEFAKEQLKQAEEYASLKGTCKDEMDKVDAHIKDAIEVMKTYEVIFNEQKGKLRRIQHIEQSGQESPEYHEKSLKEMEDTYDLIKAMKDFLNMPMSEEGKLSGKSTLFLYRAKNRLEKMIEKLY
jgi:hypothetical protein